jgi:DNA adenine methylase
MTTRKPKAASDPAACSPQPAPFLKWAGGKTKLLPEILQRLPNFMQTYYEPFLGGGAVFFALARQGRFDRAVLSDSNPNLIDCYRTLRDDVDTVIPLLKEHQHKHCRGHFEEVRALDPHHLSGAARAARFIYLNRVCYNGLYRVNRAGQFNTPFGSYKNPTICDSELLLAVSVALDRRRVTLETTDFDEQIRGRAPGKKDGVYFDPPYIPVSKSGNFVSFTKESFKEVDQQRLAALFHQLVQQEVSVVLSNSSTPMAYELYETSSTHKTDTVYAPRRINSKAEKRGDVAEILAHNAWLQVAPEPRRKKKE